MHYELCIILTTNHYAFALSFWLSAFSSAKRLIMHLSVDWTMPLLFHDPSPASFHGLRREAAHGPIFPMRVRRHAPFSCPLYQNLQKCLRWPYFFLPLNSEPLFSYCFVISLHVLPYSTPAIGVNTHGLSLDAQYFSCHSTNIHRHFRFANRQMPSKQKKSRWWKITNGMMGELPLLRHDNRRAAFAELKA